jgi:hypothetical protein
MSSSNLVRVSVIEESVYGETPASGNFKQARFVSESLSGTPETTESATIRTDRASSGQVVTGLTVSGDIQLELAKEEIIDLLLKSAMHNTWNTAATVNVDLEINASTKKLIRTTGSFVSEGVQVGDFLTLSNFVNAANNTQVMVASVSTLELNIVGPATLVSETRVGSAYDRADKLVVGQNKKSVSIEKAFLDLTTKALIYKGMAVNTMGLNFTYGEIAKASFGFVGNDYSSADAASEFITFSRTIDSPATTNSLNGSVDMPFLASSDSGALQTVGFCIQSVELNLNNNLQAQNCIGVAAPVDFSSGTAQIEVSLSAYLSNDNWNLLPKKLDQSSFALGFIVRNSGGFYGVYIPAVQVTFDDPASGGANQQISLSMRGVAKVGPNGESPITIFKG